MLFRSRTRISGWREEIRLRFCLASVCDVGRRAREPEVARHRAAIDGRRAARHPSRLDIRVAQVEPRIMAIRQDMLAANALMTALEVTMLMELR